MSTKPQKKYLTNKDTGFNKKSSSNTIKKSYLIIIIVVCIVICFSIVFLILIPAYKESQRRQEEERIKNATIVVDLKEDLTIPFLEEAKVSDFILNINGKLIDDFEIDTSEIGEKEVSFEYVNDENIKIPYSYKINIIDDKAPDIWLGNSYSVYNDYNGNLLEDIVCADNYDDNPNCEIVGEYDTSKVGSYNLTFKAVDASNNIVTKDFTLNVSKRPTNNTTSNNKPTYTYFKDVIEKYKNDNTKIGIDVSTWQGDIDFDKLKAANVEFAFIRVGSTRGIDGEYFVDNKFVRNIEGFNRVGIPVGIYFYSYANDKESAIENAKWVLKQIEGYKVDLPIAFDWENWSFYNAFKQSFYSMTKNAKAFLDTVAESGYKGTLYSSKNYLEKVWYDLDYPVWLAHYTNNLNQSSYEGDYSYWQLCSNGKVDGINGNVDINIMYM